MNNVPEPRATRCAGLSDARGAGAPQLPGGYRLAFGDTIDFSDTPPDDAEDASRGVKPWVVLIVDDDRTVHDATVLALQGERILGRALEFRHAYAASEARELLTANQDISVVLLDVVMESADAGLKLISTIRDELGQRDVKVILRTGQPGQAPEADVRSNLAIDGYITKARLTRAMLLDALTQVLRTSEESGDPAQY